jgi:type IV secretion system protein VirB2
MRILPSYILSIRIMLGLIAGLFLVSANAVFSAVPGDPQGSSVIISAMNWLQGTLLGTVATVAAVIAVAMVGFLMLTGRMNWRHGTIVILGCFILFGATSIVAGIRATAAGF